MYTQAGREFATDHLGSRLYGLFESEHILIHAQEDTQQTTREIKYFLPYNIIPSITANHPTWPPLSLSKLRSHFASRHATPSHTTTSTNNITSNLLESSAHASITTLTKISSAATTISSAQYTQTRPLCTPCSLTTSRASKDNYQNIVYDTGKEN